MKKQVYPSYKNFGGQIQAGSKLFELYLKETELRFNCRGPESVTSSYNGFVIILCIALDSICRAEGCFCFFC